MLTVRLTANTCCEALEVARPTKHFPPYHSIIDRQFTSDPMATSSKRNRGGRKEKKRLENKVIHMRNVRGFCGFDEKKKISGLQEHRLRFTKTGTMGKTLRNNALVIVVFPSDASEMYLDVRSSISLQ
ncbi:hypothetical protein RB195_000766 [Necator americanus]|uniref:MADS-box domain-containing protein n=1 Tax=Necator americanus TaxID=51031 RepID=A0ABR1DBA2_NECAM